MANSLQTRAALQVMGETFFENFPLSEIAHKGVNIQGDQIAPMYRGKTYTLDRPNPNQFVASATSPGVTPAANQDVIALPMTITLDQDYNVKFAPTDLEVAQASWEGKLSQTLKAARDVLAAKLEAALVAKSIIGGFRQITKTADSLYDLAAIKNELLKNGVGTGRSVLALPDVLPWISNPNLLSSLIGRGAVAGFRMDTALGELAFCHQLIGQSYTNGTGTNYVANGAHAIGSQSIVLKTGANPIKAGDIVTFAGSTQQYLIETGITAPGTVKIYPGLKVALADGDAMTMVTSTATTLGVAVHESALGVAFGEEAVSPADASKLLGYEKVTTENGVTLIYEKKREWAQTSETLRVIYGVGSVYPDGVVKIKLS